MFARLPSPLPFLHITLFVIHNIVLVLLFIVSSTPIVAALEDFHHLESDMPQRMLAATFCG